MHLRGAEQLLTARTEQEHEQIRSLPEVPALVHLAHHSGKGQWLTRDPGAGPLLDQSWHKGWITAAALVAAGPARCPAEAPGRPKPESASCDPTPPAGCPRTGPRRHSSSPT